MGLAAHAMGGFDATKLATALDLPAGHVQHAVVALGKQGHPASLPEALQAREMPNGRMALAEIAHHGKF